jgi:hypothetical protein
LPTNDVSRSHVVFNESTTTLGIELHVAHDECLWGRVYARPTDAAAYQLVGAPGTHESDSDLISCNGPHLMFLRREGSRRPGGWRFGKPGLWRVDLPRCHAELLAVPGIESDVWLSALHSVSPDGTAVFASVGREDHGKISYWVARVELATGDVDYLVPLEAVFA